jgi:hypothetical protein
MMMNPASLEAYSTVIWADAPRQGKPMLSGELQEQARRAFDERKKADEHSSTR